MALFEMLPEVSITKRGSITSAIKKYRGQLNDPPPDNAIDYLESSRHQQENAGSEWAYWIYLASQTHIDIP
jgi:hypothetical protein